MWLNRLLKDRHLATSQNRKKKKKVTGHKKNTKNKKNLNRVLSIPCNQTTGGHWKWGRVSIRVRGWRVVVLLATPVLVCCWCRGLFGFCRVSSFLPSVVVAAKPLLHLRLSASFARKVVVACVHRSFAGNTRMIRFSSSSSLPPAASSSLLTLSSPHIDMLL